MKKLLIIPFIMVAMVSLLYSCRTDKYYTTSTTGQDNVAYVVVLSDKYTGYANIVLDGQNCAHQKIYKVKTQRKSAPVAIPVGKHNIKVLIENNVMYTEDNIFIGLQETKKIILK